MGEREISMENMEMNKNSRTGLFGNVYRGKRVLVTGDTGFKGSWLAMWLLSLGADVTGYSLYIPSKPSNFEVCGLKKRIRHITEDIRNFQALQKVFHMYMPEIVFHLAAQPIVRRSYDEPKSTFDTNIGGTVNILECIRTSPCVKASVIITSDKCYENRELTRGYRENDVLGGIDPYSASKACAEIAFKSYYESFFRNFKNRERLASARAGNVIGGGDWAADRIVPDCVREWARNRRVSVRNPLSTRPWQHVLEPLSGYLWLGAHLVHSDSVNGQSFNFGPGKNVNKTVAELIKLFAEFWDNGKWNHVRTGKSVKESALLKLSCEKALNLLRWRAALRFDETVRLTAEWYKAYYSGFADMYAISLKQMDKYIGIAGKRKLAWVLGKLP